MLESTYLLRARGVLWSKASLRWDNREGLCEELALQNLHAKVDSFDTTRFLLQYVSQ